MKQTTRTTAQKTNDSNEMSVRETKVKKKGVSGSNKVLHAEQLRQ